MDKLKDKIFDGSALGIVGMLSALAIQYPEMLKDFLMFGLAWILLRKGVRSELGGIAKVFTEEISKITKSIERLTETMASLEKNHDARLTNLEIKVDKLSGNSPGKNKE